MVLESINKHIYLLFLLFPLKGQAQPIRTEYYIGLWESANEHKYDIKRLITQTDSGYQIRDYRKNAKLKFEGLFASIDPVVEHGHFSFYGKKGELEAEGNYVNGVLSGRWKFYNENGSLRKEVDYNFIIASCDTTGEYERKLFYTTLDSTREERIAVYPGGDSNAMYQYLYEQLVFPPLAEMYFKSGIVIGKFKVDEHGDICDVHTEGDMDKDLQMETRRVLSLFSKWEPGTIDGVPVPVIMTFPIRFQFQ